MEYKASIKGEKEIQGDDHRSRKNEGKGAFHGIGRLWNQVLFIRAQEAA